MEIIFEWDARKARANLEKHKISFEEAQTIFTDPFLVTFPDEFHSEKEERLMSIGMSMQERVLLVVHTEREEISERSLIRIISCRKATTSERKIYEENEKSP
ncbi:MAG: BrnT family toxin [Anaerolineae bacterium]|nr:BrnT family toxin [Anaerolineae bacterium]MCI0609691.1 BrnT family toxin [Anaerolineae bacterium]